MKNLTLILSFLPLFLSGQNIPTPGFEDWYIGNVIQRPQGWITSNISSVSQFGIYSVHPDHENFIQGITSCKLTTYQEHPDSMPRAAFITNGQPQMDYETFEVDFITGGTEFPYKPLKMLGFYKYSSDSPIEDFGQAKVILKKYNEATGMQDTIGYGENLLLNPAQDFTLFEVPINYLVPDVTPDSIVVVFHSTYPDFPNTGATLWLDSLHFDFSTNLKVPEEGIASDYFTISPNPVKDRLKLEIKTPKTAYLNVYDSTQRTIHVQKVHSASSLELNISKFSPGLYFISLFDKTQKLLQTKKVIIH